MCNVESATGDEADTTLRVRRLVLVQEVELVALELVVTDVSVTGVSLQLSMIAYPLPARKRTSLPSAKKGIMIPALESRLCVSRLVRPAVSQRES